MIGLNSPWGNRGEICKAFHWTYDYLLWGISWLNVMTFIADAARPKDTPKSNDDEPSVNIELKTEEDIKNWIDNMM